MNKPDSLKKNSKKAGNFSTAFLRFSGIVFLSVFFLTAAVFLIPGLMRIRSYYVVSGSMEPKIPVGSMVYVRECNAEELEAGDIIAFSSNGTVVTHRVTENDTVNKELHTKGDRNGIEDMLAVSYGDVIGKYVCHLPYVGIAGAFLSTFTGRIMLIMIGCIGMLLTAYAGRGRKA